MQAAETKLRQLIEGTKQYVVPLFQRPYSWTEKHWKTLWADVVEQSQQEDGRPHFFGSIVTAPAKSVPQGVGKYLLIDGQQRITTTQILLAAIRDCAGRSDDKRLRDRIDGQYLTNSYEHDDERLKLLPTQDDRSAFHAIIKCDPIPDSRLATCYRFFSARIEQLPEGTLDRIHLAIVDRLSLVSITCDEHDNPHLIFESLNAKGEKLTPADLIRNFLLMRVHVNDQARLFNKYWLPMQQALGSELTEFVRHYLMKEGKILKEADVYFELKDRLANAKPLQAEEFLANLHRHGLHYAKFVGTSTATDHDIAESLDRVRRLKVTVAYPLLLRVFDAHGSGLLTHAQVLETLNVLESLVIRRSICSFPSNQLRRMLPPVFDAAGGASPEFIQGLRLQLGGKRCPDDAAFVASLVKEPLYASAEKNTRLRLILERLELSFQHKEPANVSGSQIEHVMPQTMTQEWITEIGAARADEAKDLLHTLGNLTLTKYNSELSNKSFAFKKNEFSSSHFVLNNYFADVGRWSPEAIRERARSLSLRVVAIWIDVGRPAGASTTENQPAKVPKKIRFRHTVQSVTTWKDAFVKLLMQFEANDPGLMERLVSEQSMYSILAMTDERFRRSKSQIGDVFINTHASAVTLQDWCRRIAVLGSLSLDDFEFLT